MTTAAPYRLEILRHVDQTHGGNYWVWSLITADGDQRAGGRVGDLSGDYDLDGGAKTMGAERIADQVCRQRDIDRGSVAVFFMQD
jgi:hypothetical protein